MKWSWKLGEFAGIGVFVHWTFLILIGYIVLSSVYHGADFATAAGEVIFVLSIFACVVLHEFGHALTARRYGIRTRDITLLPIGGVARLERMPEDPVQEFWVAIAGPAVNVAIALGVLVLILLTGGISKLFTVDLAAGGFLHRLFWVNAMLVFFNLLPAFPMDGGRVLRAVLAHVTGDFVGATQRAASIGQIMAIALGFLGLLVGNPFLIFIALFVYLGAQEEAHMVQIQSVFRGVPVRAAMMTRIRTLSPDDTLRVAADELLAGSQQDFPVVEGDRVLGIVLRRDVLKSLAEGGADVHIRDVMHTDCPTIEDTEMLNGTFQRMREGACSSVPVTHNGRLAGMLSLENVGELMMIHAALDKSPNRDKIGTLFGDDSI